jgi:hypothetical protein
MKYVGTTDDGDDFARQRDITGRPVIFGMGVPTEPSEDGSLYVQVDSTPTVLELWQYDSAQNTATDFDGTDDRITTTYSTRRNLCDNPSFETNTTNWAGVLSTIARTTDQAYAGTYSLKVTATAASASPFFNLEEATGLAVPAREYTWSVYVKPVQSGRNMRLQLVFRNGVSNVNVVNGTTTNSIPTGEWTRLEVTGTSGALVDNIFCYIQVDRGAAGTAGDITYIDGAMIEVASSAGTYFDGTGYIDESGDWVSDPGGHVGWLGTAHASASDKGCFANGTTRTFCGWAYRDASADADTLIGNTGSPSHAQLSLSSGSQNVVFNPGGGATTWTSAWPGNGEWVHYALVFDEPGSSNNISLYLNGALVSTQTNTAQFSRALQSAAGNFNVGVFAGNVNPFNGKMAWVSVHEKALTAEEIEISAASRRFSADQLVSFGGLGILLALDAASGLSDLSGNVRNGTAAGGTTIGGVTGPGEPEWVATGVSFLAYPVSNDGRIRTTITSGPTGPSGVTGATGPSGPSGPAGGGSGTLTFDYGPPTDLWLIW